MRKLRTWAAVATMVAVAGAAQASLVLQANGVEVLDTDTNLLWLHNWNASGLKNWADAKTWAAALTVGATTAGDWRLPEIGEYGTLFAEHGDLTLVAAFTQVRPGYYWSATDAPGSFAKAFFPVAGIQNSLSEFDQNFAVAVRAGTVVLGVPEPQTLGLVLVALGAMGVLRNTRPASRF